MITNTTYIEHQENQTIKANKLNVYALLACIIAKDELSVSDSLVYMGLGQDRDDIEIPIV